jgi:mRNA export factor
MVVAESRAVRLTVHVYFEGGWDKKLKYWDLRTQAAVGEVLLEEKVYAMDARDFLLVVGTADQPAAATGGLLAPMQQNKQNSDRQRKIYCFDLRKPNVATKVENSPLQYQTRCLAAFPGGTGYLVGSIEGRVGVQNFEGLHPDKQASYTFKCHRRTLDANGNVTQAKVRPQCALTQIQPVLTFFCI